VQRAGALRLQNDSATDLIESRKMATKSELLRSSAQNNSAAVSLRLGQWVVADDGQVGVVNAIASDGLTAEFHRIGVDGLTQLALVVPVASLRQAGFLDIPESRRPKRALARRFGYI
jgi:hypothetical protein